MKQYLFAHGFIIMTKTKHAIFLFLFFSLISVINAVAEENESAIISLIATISQTIIPIHATIGL